MHTYEYRCERTGAWAARCTGNEDANFRFPSFDGRMMGRKAVFGHGKVDCCFWYFFFFRFFEYYALLMMGI